MNETLFFNGRLLKRSLPLFKGPPPPHSVGPRRLLLAQGELANFHDADEAIRYIAFLELRTGTIRGNHVHRIKLEHVYLFSGRLVVLAKDSQAEEVVTLQMQAGDLLTIQTGIAHAFKPVEAGYAVEFSPTRFNAGDTEKVALM